LLSINLGHSKKFLSEGKDDARYERAKRTEVEQRKKDEDNRFFNELIEVIGTSEIEAMIKELVQETLEETHDNIAPTESTLLSVLDNFVNDSVAEGLRSVSEEAFEIEIVHRAETKCDCTTGIITLKEELKNCHDTIAQLSTKLKEHLPPFCEESVQDDGFVIYYTGLPNAKVSKTIFTHVLKTMPFKGTRKLTPFQKFMCVMQKLRLNIPEQCLAYQFSISKTTVSRIIVRWLVQMDIRLRDLIIWPDRDSLRKTMPICFQQSFGKAVAVIIDCFEVYLDRPSNLKACT